MLVSSPVLLLGDELLGELGAELLRPGCAELRFCDCALNSSANQFQPSRNGLITRAAPDCRGETTCMADASARCTGPFDGSRKYTVSRATDSTTRMATTMRRRSARLRATRSVGA